MKRLVEFLINSKSTGIIKSNNVNFIDLGLSVLWADRNIGAKEEKDPGNYYQWGGLEIITENASWENYPLKENFDNNKKNFAPNNILSKERDVAYQTYKGSSHIPTSEQFYELLKNTNIELIKDAHYYFIVTSKINNNQIILPGTGYIWEQQIENRYDRLFYWTSTLEYYQPKENNIRKALSLSFIKEEKYPTLTSNVVFCGFTVRAVKDK